MRYVRLPRFFFGVWPQDWNSRFEAGASNIDGVKRVAFGAGTNSPIRPVEKSTGKFVVFALAE